MGKRRPLSAAIGADAKAFVRAGTPTPAMVEADPPAELVNLSVRIKPALARSLRLAAAERSVDRIEPYTQQAIVAEALAQWLKEADAFSE